MTTMKSRNLVSRPLEQSRIDSLGMSSIRRYKKLQPCPRITMDLGSRDSEPWPIQRF